jgi:hypothetical protein
MIDFLNGFEYYAQGKKQLFRVGLSYLFCLFSALLDFILANSGSVESTQG